MAAEGNGSAPAVRNLIKLAEVQRRTALSRSSIYAKVASGTFPRPVKRGSSSVWVDTEVQSWIDDLIAARDQRHAA